MRSREADDCVEPDVLAGVNFAAVADTLETAFDSASRRTGLLGRNALTDSHLLHALRNRRAVRVERRARAQRA